jgi:hypothetical protein
MQHEDAERHADAGPPRRFACTRRAALTAWLPATALGQGSGPAWLATPWPVPEPLLQLRAAESDGWLAVGTSGALWHLRAEGAAQRRGSAIDVRTPVAAAHGRLVARRSDGRLWIAEAGGAPADCDVLVAPEAGFVILPLGVIAVVVERDQARLVRVEPDSRGAWRVVARSRDAVLPDARPLQAALDGGADGDGHIAVLAGPDAQRYAHGVLGDAIEATRVLLLERHDLSPLRELTLDAPYVFEDNRLRSWRAGDSSALLTVRSGPRGAQIAMVESDPAHRAALRLAALGEPIGSPNRWLSPSTDGTRMVAVITPHLAGTLHAVRRAGECLVSSVLTQGVSNHVIGSRELDVAAWLGPRYVLASLSRAALHSVDVDARRVLAPLELAAPLRAISADAQRRLLGCALADGSARLLVPS